MESKPIDLKSDITATPSLETDVYLPTAGPWPKSHHTHNLEYIVRALLRGEHFECIRIGTDYHIQLPGITFNWTETCKWSHFEHVTLGPEDFALYTTYLTSKHMPPKEARPALIIAKTQQYQNELYKSYLKARWPLPEPMISFQEMQAINVYTSSFYKTMNAVLRNELELDAYSKRTVRAAIINAVLCVSGLTRIPQTQLTDAYRMASLKPLEHAAQVQAAATHGVVSLSGFVSASLRSDVFQSKPVCIQIKQLKGAYIAPISEMPHEEEFLMPPTQIQITSYRKTKHKHYFEATVVSDLNQLSPESLELGQATPTVPTVAFNRVLTELLNKAHTEDIPIKFNDFIETNHDLVFFMQHANPEHQAALFTYHDGQWDQLIKNTPMLSTLLRYCTLEQTTRLCTSWPAWLDLIQTAKDFQTLMNTLSQEQRIHLSPLFNNKWPYLVTSGFDLLNILPYLNTEQVIELCTSLKHEWPHLLTSSLEFDAVLKRLSLDQQPIIIQACQSNWRAMIHNGYEVADIMPLLLNPEQQTALLTQFSGQWRELITSAEEFSSVIKTLSPTQRDEVYTEFKGQWEPLIKHNLHFLTLYAVLNPEQQHELFTCCKATLVERMYSAFVFKTTLSGISPTQATELYVACLQQANNEFTPSADDVNVLPTAHKNAIYKHLINPGHDQAIDASPIKPPN